MSLATKSRPKISHCSPRPVMASRSRAGDKGGTASTFGSSCVNWTISTNASRCQRASMPSNRNSPMQGAVVRMFPDAQEIADAPSAITRQLFAIRTMSPPASDNNLRGRRRAAQQPLHAQVLVDVGPMDAIAGTRHFPIGALGGRSPGETRIRGDRTAIVLPSARSTISRPSSKRTAATRSSALMPPSASRLPLPPAADGGRERTIPARSARRARQPR